MEHLVSTSLGMVGRRSVYEYMSESERACLNAIGVIEEKAGCHPMLTKAQTLIQQARDLIADHVEEKFYDPFLRDQEKHRIDHWLSAALDDPLVCKEFKADIEAYFHE